MVEIVRSKAAPPVSEQPYAHLVAWRIVANGDDWFLLGYCQESKKYRITSPLKVIDLVNQTATTSSSRRYQLVGPPAIRGVTVDDDTDAALVVLAWNFGVSDITEMVVDDPRH